MKDYTNIETTNGQIYADSALYCKSVESVLSKADVANRYTIINRLMRARDNREMMWKEFDDMTYTQYYNSNREIDLAYNRPQLNQEDKRVTSGTTHEKDIALLSFLLSYDWVPFVDAYDEKNEIMDETGQVLTKMVERSRMIEGWEKKKHLFYQEFIAQGDVFAEEMWSVEYKKTAKTNGWTPDQPFSKFKLESVDVEKFELAKVELHYGIEVYLGNMQCEFIEDQPFIFTYQVVPRASLEPIFQNYHMWQYVPMNIDLAVPQEIGAAYSYNYFLWNLSPIQKGYVGILKYQCKKDNQYQIFLNGVPMLPHNYPLTAINPSGEYTIRQGKYESIPHFAYSKGTPAKTKYDQDLIDEVMRLMVGKMQISYKPPMGAMSRKYVNRNVLRPAQVTPGISKNEIYPLLDPAQTSGLSQSDFAFYEYVSQQIDNKSLNKTFAAETQPDSVTATQILTEKNEQLRKLGRAIDGILHFESDLTWSRIYTLLNHWTQPVAWEDLIDPATGKPIKESDGLTNKRKAKYRTEEMNTTLPGGEPGRYVMRFSTDTPPTRRQLTDEQYRMQKKTGKETNIAVIDPIKLQSLKANFFVKMKPQPKDDSELEKQIFIENLQTAQNMFGIDAINQGNAKKEFAKKAGIDAREFFVSEEELQAKRNAMQSNAITDATQTPGQKTPTPVKNNLKRTRPTKELAMT